MRTRKNNRRKVVVGTAVAAALLIVPTWLAVMPGCSIDNDFLGLEDGQRDLLFGALAYALLQGQVGGDFPPGQPIPGEDGVSCWDLDGNGECDVEAEDITGDGQCDALDCRGVDGATGVDGPDGVPGPDGQDGADGLACWDSNGDGVGDPAEDLNNDGQFDALDCQGVDGARGRPGASGAPGTQGDPGPAGTSYFDQFIDDFFTYADHEPGELGVNIVSIIEPTLGTPENTAGDAGAIAYRYGIPVMYDVGNDVTMRLSFYRSGPWWPGQCLVFTLDALRLRNGEGITQYGSRRWVRPDVQMPNAVRRGLGELLLGNGDRGGVFIVIDIPINAQDGIDDPEPLLSGDLLAFEIATAIKPDLSVWDDGGRYELLGVEFFESATGTAQLVGATLFAEADDVNCGEITDCNENGFDDAFDILNGDSSDCNENGIPDECEIDCNENGVADECDIADGTSFDCDENGVPDECAACPPLDLVFLMDTSGSMQDEGTSLCNAIDGIVTGLALRGIVVNPDIMAIAPHFLEDLPPCVSSLGQSVEGRFPDTIPGNNGSCPATLTANDDSEKDENWGSATAIIAEHYPWTAGSIRMIVPISDEGACLGDSCFDPGEDRDAVENAIAVANANDVIVSPIAGDGSSACVVNLGRDLALGTGGTFFESGDPSADLAGPITDIVETACQLFSDCNLNDVPDSCEPDCNDNGIPDACDISCFADECGACLDAPPFGSVAACAGSYGGMYVLDTASARSLDRPVVALLAPDGTLTMAFLTETQNIYFTQTATVGPDGSLSNGYGQFFEIWGDFDLETCAATGSWYEIGGDMGDWNVSRVQCASDCNLNEIPDSCDIAAGTSLDVNQNGFPDECEFLISLEGWWQVFFRAQDSCEPDHYQDFTFEVRYFRFDANNQLVENRIEIPGGTSTECIQVEYPDINGPNYLEYRFNGIYNQDTNRTIESQSFDPFTGALSIEELVDVPNRQCFGEEGVTMINGNFTNGAIVGDWTFQISQDTGFYGVCSGEPLTELCGPFDATRIDGPPNCTIVNGPD